MNERRILGRRLESKKAASFFSPDQLALMQVQAYRNPQVTAYALRLMYSLGKASTEYMMPAFMKVCDLKCALEMSRFILNAAANAAKKATALNISLIEEIARLSTGDKTFQVAATLILAGLSQEDMDMVIKDHFEVHEDPVMKTAACSFYEAVVIPCLAENGKAQELILACLHSPLITEMRRRRLHLQREGWMYTSTFGADPGESKFKPSILVQKLTAPYPLEEVDVTVESDDGKVLETVTTVAPSYKNGYEELFSRLGYFPPVRDNSELCATPFTDEALDKSIHVSSLLDEPWIKELPADRKWITFHGYNCAEIRCHAGGKNQSTQPASVSIILSASTHLYACADHFLCEADMHAEACDWVGTFFAFNRGEIWLSQNGRDDFGHKKARPALLNDLITLGRKEISALSGKGDIPRNALAEGKPERSINEIIDTWFEFEAEKNPFYKEVHNLYKDCVKNGIRFPLVLTEIKDCHCWHDYFTKHYKKAGAMGINFNKFNPLISFLLIKASPHISKSDLQYVAQLMRNVYDEDAEDLMESAIYPVLASHKSMHVKLFLTKCYAYRLTSTKEQIEAMNKDKTFLDCLSPWFVEECDTTSSVAMSPKRQREYLCSGAAPIQDWISMLLQLKMKVPMKKNSLKKLTDAHNELSTIYLDKIARKEKDRVLVPKRSKFNRLEKKLPKDVERIISRRRLFSEGKIQQHCVASYEKSIERDETSIFSYVSKVTGARHTIEIIKEEDGFYVRQIQKKHNSGSDPDVVEMLTKALGESATRRFNHRAAFPADAPAIELPNLGRPWDEDFFDERNENDGEVRYRIVRDVYVPWDEDDDDLPF